MILPFSHGLHKGLHHEICFFKITGKEPVYEHNHIGMELTIPKINLLLYQFIMEYGKIQTPNFSLLVTQAACYHVLIPQSSIELQIIFCYLKYLSVTLSNQKLTVYKARIGISIQTTENPESQSFGSREVVVQSLLLSTHSFRKSVTGLFLHIPN